MSLYDGGSPPEYHAGYKHGFEAGLKLGQPKWISVKDRLPEHDRKVLIFDTFPFTGCYTNAGWLNYYDHSHENPSHWMEIPSIPEITS